MIRNAGPRATPRRKPGRARNPAKRCVCGAPASMRHRCPAAPVWTPGSFPVLTATNGRFVTEGWTSGPFGLWWDAQAKAWGLSLVNSGIVLARLPQAANSDMRAKRLARELLKWPIDWTTYHHGLTELRARIRAEVETIEDAKKP